MFKLVLLVAALAFTGQVSAMAGGEVVADSSFSFEVAIRPFRGNVALPTCSGIIVQGENTNAYILTSATCAMSGNRYDIHLGVNRVSVTTVPDISIDASTAIIHPGFLNTFTESDLAIIPDPGVIASHLNGTNTTRKTVSAALLPNVDDVTSSYLAAAVTMAGWGYPNEVFSAASPTLRQLSSRVVFNTICTLSHLGKPINNRHICVNGLFNRGPCTGDSGAPLVIRQTTGARVIGLATLTPTNGCSRGRPGVFTRLGHYLPWIQQVTTYDVNQ